MQTTIARQSLISGMSSGLLGLCVVDFHSVCLIAGLMIIIYIRIGFKPTLRARSTQQRVVVTRAAAGEYEWLKKEPLALMIGSAGWFIPSNIGVSAFGGKSLFGLFTESIGTNLANFPQGPALTDSFWLYMVTWHLGLFITLTLAQIGIQGRKQQYW
jgi:photosystem I subunit PsaO